MACHKAIAEAGRPRNRNTHHQAAGDPFNGRLMSVANVSPLPNRRISLIHLFSAIGVGLFCFCDLHSNKWLPLIRPARSLMKIGSVRWGNPRTCSVGRDTQKADIRPCERLRDLRQHR